MTLIVGLGASLGDCAATLRLAVAALAADRALGLAGTSRLYATPPDGGVAHRVFLNAAARLETDLPPEEVLARLRRLERVLGRQVTRRWADRRVDLDLLAGDGPPVATPTLTLPHPRLRGRPFALVPLVEVWPEGADPADGVRYRDLPAARVPLTVVGALPRPRRALADRAAAVYAGVPSEPS